MTRIPANSDKRETEAAVNEPVLTDATTLGEVLEVLEAQVSLVHHLP